MVTSTDDQKSKEEWQIRHRDGEQAARPATVAAAKQSDRAPAEHERAEERGAGEVPCAAEAERHDRERGQHLEQEPDEDRRQRRALAALVGQDLEAGGQVVLLPEDGDREKMRDLPEEDDAEEREPGGRERAGAGGPAEERRHRARDRSDEKRVHRALLHRRVDEDVEDERDRAEEPG